jgi:hypothetical protein
MIGSASGLRIGGTFATDCRNGSDARDEIVSSDHNATPGSVVRAGVSTRQFFRKL